ncbi:WD40 repeat domain-containing protein [Candidatus Entotheonella palauensis]|uniref:WD40 repeat domain-containing protein n=1 Tax=Candidatus Entotheonella palauensis TaxID=93172 RepID=UPI0015C42D61|nr:hypothetical protein [Candidatus Entotheonella palauensis]
MRTAPIIRIDVDADGRFLVTGSLDKTVQVWDVQTGRLLQVIRVPQSDGNLGKLSGVAISPDGATVAAGGWTAFRGIDTNIFLFDRATGVLRHRIAGLPNVCYHLTFSPDGKHLAATLGGANGLRIYETQTYTRSLLKTAIMAGPRNGRILTARDVW